MTRFIRLTRSSCTYTEKRGNKNYSERAKRKDITTVLYEYYLCLLHPESVLCVKQSKVAGLGLYLRRKKQNISMLQHDSKASFLPTSAWGTLHKVENDLYGELIAQGYPFPFHFPQDPF